MARLLKIQEDEFTEYILAEQTLLGRSKDCNINISGSKISRKHARIYKDKNKYTLEDLGSSNGTYLNGHRMTSANLADGDLLRLGEGKFIFSQDDKDPLINSNLKGYNIKIRIGSGSMGTVYLSHQLSMSRLVAIKVLNEKLSNDEEFVNSFKDEAKLAGRLNHPNVIAVHDFGFENNCYFFSMEYIEGENLQELINRSGALPVPQAIDFTLQVAQGLEHAHGLDIIHRDIKPLNIIIGQNNLIKIADLGLAKQLYVKDQNGQQSGRVIGTPQYMAPEILRKEPAEQRSDIYSLGATLFHMTTGKPPFSGSNTTEVVRKRLEEPTPDALRFNHKISPYVAAFISKMMSAEIEQRPNNMTQVLKELKVAASGKTPAPAQIQPVKAVAAPPLAEKDSPPATPKQTAKGLRNPRTQAKIIMYLASVAVAAVLAWLVYIALKPTEEAKASALLEEAKQYAAQNDIGNALDTVQTVLQKYNKTPAATEAQQLAQLYSNKKKIYIYQQQYEHGGLDGAGLKLLLNKLQPKIKDNKLQAEVAKYLASLPVEKKEPVEKTLSEEDIAQQDEQVAKRVWEKSKPIINRLLEENRSREAKKALIIHIESHPGTQSGDEASRMLMQIKTTEAKILQNSISKAKQLVTNKNYAQAWRLLENLYFKNPEQETQRNLKKIMLQIDASIAKQFYHLYQSSKKSFRELSPEKVNEKLAKKETEFEDLPWQRNIISLQNQAFQINSFRASLRRSISSKNNYKIGIYGYEGLHQITLTRKNNLAVRLTETSTPQPMPWSILSEKSIWNLAPPDKMQESSALGASTYFIERNHLGFAKSYLTHLPQKKESIKKVREQIWAAKNKQVILESFYFSSFSRIKRWHPLSGIWNIENGRLSGIKAPANVALGSRVFRLQNLSLSLNLKREGKGAFKIIFDSCGQGELAVVFTARNTRIFFEEPIEETIVDNAEALNEEVKIKQAKGDALANLEKVRIQIKPDKIRVKTNNKELVSLPLTLKENPGVILRFEFEAMNGSIDDLIISTKLP